MKTGTFLDMDMAQLGRSAREVYRWWVAELGAMIPVRWQRHKAQRLSGLIAFAESGGGFSVDGVMREAGIGNSDAATILLSRNRALVRTISLPPLGRDDLRKLVALDLDRLMPFPPGAGCADVSADGMVTEDGRSDVQVAAIAKDELAAIWQGALDHGFAPRAIGIADGSGAHLEFDFLPALVAAGIATPVRRSRGWWLLVALLFAANIGVMVWKDMQRNTALEELVATQQPLVTAARKMAVRLTGEDKTRAALMEARRKDNALAALALVTRVVPAGAWVQRYSWNGEVLRLSGYKQPGVDVLAALRKSGSFASVRATTSDVAAESATGQPFDVTAAWAK
jgi:hypothetical protein